MRTPVARPCVPFGNLPGGKLSRKKPSFQAAIWGLGTDNKCADGSPPRNPPSSPTELGNLVAENHGLDVDKNHILDAGVNRMTCDKQLGLADLQPWSPQKITAPD
jgi:hypothetical protein